FPGLADQLPDVLRRMAENGVGAAVCIGVNLEDLPKVLAIAESNERLFATVGVHPEYTDVGEPTEDQLVGLAAHPKVVAIGETGLDYYWQKDQPEWQRQRFRRHIAAANRWSFIPATRLPIPFVCCRRKGPKRRVASCTVLPRTGTSPARHLILAFISRFPASSPSRMRASSRKSRRSVRSTDFSSRPIRPISLRCRIAASPTNRPTSATWPKKSP